MVHFYGRRHSFEEVLISSGCSAHLHSAPMMRRKTASEGAGGGGGETKAERRRDNRKTNKRERDNEDSGKTAGRKMRHERREEDDETVRRVGLGRTNKQVERSQRNEKGGETEDRWNETEKKTKNECKSA